MTKLIKGLGLALLLSGSIVGTAHATLMNVAIGGTATASAEYDGSRVAGNAIDGDYLTRWNAGAHPTQWIEIDLGAKYWVTNIMGLVAQSPQNISTNHNVYFDGVLDFSWSGITSDGDMLSKNFGAGSEVQKIRVETTSSASWVAWKEIEVYADVAQVPEPASLALIGLGLLGLGFSRRKAK